MCPVLGFYSVSSAHIPQYGEHFNSTSLAYLLSKRFGFCETMVCDVYHRLDFLVISTRCILLMLMFLCILNQELMLFILNHFFLCVTGNVSACTWFALIISVTCMLYVQSASKFVMIIQLSILFPMTKQFLF